jgi:hypothetical protein
LPWLILLDFDKKKSFVWIGSSSNEAHFVCVLCLLSNFETSWWYKVLAFDWPWWVSLMLLTFMAVGVNNLS